MTDKQPYAEMPADRYSKSGNVTDTGWFNIHAMRAFADATHALRTQALAAQAPQQAAPQQEATVAELDALAITPVTGGEPVAWMDDFGNAFPLAANKGAWSWMDAHKRTWKPLYTSPQPLREPLNTIDLMRVVMKADEETRGNALRGTTNWAGHIGKAVQNAVLGIKGGQHGTD